MKFYRGHQQRVARLPDDGWMDDQSYYEDFYYEESEDEGDDYSKKPVPILLSIILVIAYIIGGAFLFQMWEGWSFLDRYHFPSLLNILSNRNLLNSAPTFVSSLLPQLDLETSPQTRKMLMESRELHFVPFIFYLGSQ